MIDRAEEARLVAAWQAGDRRAGGRLLEMHAGLLHAVIKPFRRMMDVDDLLQAAREGFLSSALTYEEGRGAALATYCWWGAFGAVQKEIGRGAHAVVVGSGARRDGVLAHRKGEPRPGWFGRAFSLDAPVAGHEERRDVSHRDRLVDEEPLPGVKLEERQWSAEALKQLAGLPARDREVLTRRFLAEEPETLQQIADDLGLTRERVRQIEAAALLRLRRRLLAMT